MITQPHQGRSGIRLLDYDFTAGDDCHLLHADKNGFTLDKTFSIELKARWPSMPTGSTRLCTIYGTGNDWANQRQFDLFASKTTGPDTLRFVLQVSDAGSGASEARTWITTTHHSLTDYPSSLTPFGFFFNSDVAFASGRYVMEIDGAGQGNGGTWSDPGYSSGYSVHNATAPFNLGQYWGDSAGSPTSGTTWELDYFRLWNIRRSTGAHGSDKDSYLTAADETGLILNLNMNHKYGNRLVDDANGNRVTNDGAGRSFI